MHPMINNFCLPQQKFGLRFSHLKSLLLFHGTKPVKHNTKLQLVEPVNPAKNNIIYRYRALQVFMFLAKNYT